MRIIRKLFFKTLPLLLIVGAIFVVSSCFRAIIPSSSMYPLLEKGDQLLIKKMDASEIERGDVIVFYKDNVLYIKRVIGLPGETVYIENGNVYINGCLLREDYVENKDTYNGQFIVPEDSYFVLGDNRVNSKDSRYWPESYVKADSIMGKAIIKIYPIENIGIIEGVEYEIY